jgi:hypothetical protein
VPVAGSGCPGGVPPGQPGLRTTVHQRFAEWSEARMWVELHRAPRHLPSPRRQPNWCNYG